jgi:hypothetical protein
VLTGVTSHLQSDGSSSFSALVADKSRLPDGRYMTRLNDPMRGSQETTATGSTKVLYSYDHDANVNRRMEYWRIPVFAANQGVYDLRVRFANSETETIQELLSSQYVTTVPIIRGVETIVYFKNNGWSVESTEFRALKDAKPGKISVHSSYALYDVLLFKPAKHYENEAEMRTYYAVNTIARYSSYMPGGAPTPAVGEEQCSYGYMWAGGFYITGDHMQMTTHDLVPGLYRVFVRSAYTGPNGALYGKANGISKDVFVPSGETVDLVFDGTMLR